MSRRWKERLSNCARLVALCALAASGCASWQLPRIDPTGERILIMPGEPQPTYTGPVAPGALQAPPMVPPPPPPGAVPGGPIVTTTPITPPPPLGAAPMVGAPPVVAPPPPTIGMPQGNLQAAPVYPDAGLAPTPGTATPPGLPLPPGTPGACVAPPTPISPAVDAQWAIPASTTAEGGRALILTTRVNKRSDGTPLPGWVIRYEVTGAAATANGGSGMIDVATDASGRASVEVAPSEPGGGTAIVNVALLPPTPQGGAAVELSRGSSVITWTPAPPGALVAIPPSPSSPPGGMPGLPPPPVSGPSYGPPSGPSYGQPSYGPPPYGSSATPSEGRPALPPDTPTTGRYGQPNTGNSSPNSTFTSPPPPSNEKPAGKPRLEVALRRTSPEPVHVGDYARFEVTVTNRGEGMARNIVVLDRFDRGLEHAMAQPNEQAVRYNRMRDLPTGEFDTVALTFKVVSAGRLCHHVSVTADDAMAATADGCITAVDPLPQTPPTLEVTKQGPIRQYVGDVALFKTVVKNSGQTPVTNVEIIDQYAAGLDPVPEGNAEELARGRLVWRIDRLVPGERREFTVRCSCVTASKSACSTVQVKADGGVSYGDQKCVEILDPNATPFNSGPALQPPAPAPGVGASAGAGEVKVSIVESAGPARVGAPLTLFVNLENPGATPKRNVALRLSVPEQMRPIAGQIRPAGGFRIVGDREVQFNAIVELRPGDRQTFEVPVQVDRAGNAYVYAQVVADGMAQPQNVPPKTVQILPATGN